MRGLAERLDVAPNALYSYVPSKTALIDAMLDEVLAQVATPAPTIAGPPGGLHALMASTYDVLLDHPDLVPLYLARRGARGPNAQRLGEIMLALLDRASVGGARAQEALRVLIVYTIGFAAFATTRGPIDVGDETALSADEMRGNFDAGLGWLLAGILAPPNNPIGQ